MGQLELGTTKPPKYAFVIVSASIPRDLYDQAAAKDISWSSAMRLGIQKMLNPDQAISKTNELEQNLSGVLDKLRVLKLRVMQLEAENERYDRGMKNVSTQNPK